jgi:hypothetical protein
LLTIFHFLFKLTKEKKRKGSGQSFLEKVFNLIVINSNIITIVVFSCALVVPGSLPFPKSEERMKLLFFSISSKYFWWSYSILWHYISTFSSLLYFLENEDSLIKDSHELKRIFSFSFCHPISFLIYSKIRPFLPGLEKYRYSKNDKYPYPFLKYFFEQWRRRNYLFVIFFLTFSFSSFFVLTVFFNNLKRKRAKRGKI